MKKNLFLGMVLLLSVSFMSCATRTDRSGLIMTNMTTLTATVQAIDYSSRIVTIRGPQGNVFDLHADESVRNLNQVRVGDQVKAEVLESVALYVQKHDGTQPSVKEGAAVALAPLGDKPGIAAADTIVITATVLAIDYDTRMVTLRGPEGNTKTIRVHDSAPNLEKVKAGDQVVVRHTVAVAITVNKPE